MSELGNITQIMSSFQVEDWLCVSRLPSFSVFQNQLTAKLSEEYHFALSSPHSLHSLTHLASLQHPHIATILHTETFTHYTPSDYTFSHVEVRVFCEFMEVRLWQIERVPKEDLRQLVYQTLLGMRAVYQRWRPVRATKFNIGFNKKNQLKIQVIKDVTQ